MPMRWIGSRKAEASGLSPYVIWMLWLAWVPFFVPTIAELFQEQTPLPTLVITLSCLVVFFSIYIPMSLIDARYLAASEGSAEKAIRPLRVWVVLACLTALSMPMIVLNQGGNWFSLFFYISGYTGVRLSLKQTGVTVGVLLVIVVMLGIVMRSSWAVIGSTLLFIASIGLITGSLGQLVRTTHKLRVAREEISRLAVTAERLRIARDLHDLLGHNLSLITLKSELAGRLISVLAEQSGLEEGQVDRVAREIKDIEQTARTTLQEVRDAVSSYRQPVLASELYAARDILAAAGITYQMEGDVEMLSGMPSTVEAVLSWTIREGVTNVIKHSRARQCVVRFQQDLHTISTEIINDGTQIQTTTQERGNGLRGLAERVTALGGELNAGPGTNGGFHLSVCVPLLAAAKNATGN